MRTLIFILTIFIIFSGCIEESNVTQSNESAYQDSVNITLENQSSAALSSKEGNVPEIEVKSFLSIYMHNNNEIANGYFFNWDNVPGNESLRLISYLKNDLNIIWVDNAQIAKINDNETIRVFTSNNSLEFTLKNNKTEILVTIDSHPWYDWEIRQEKGKILVYGPDKIYKSVSNITKRNYLVCDLSIKNNGSKNLDFKLSELHIRDGDQIFNTTILDPYSLYEKRSYLEMFSASKKETKIDDTTLLPGQTINGSVIFQVNSLYNESFLLMYNETPVPSASFEKSIEALRTAERYNYSITFGIPPYNTVYSNNSFEPDLEEYPYIWPNWVNRSVFEVLNKADSENLAKSSIEDIPQTEAIYALKVMPERNMTSMLESDTTSVPPVNNFIVVDDTGEELINTSLIGKIAILNNQTYKLYSDKNDIPQMNFSNATIVKISYFNDYNGARFSFVDQDLILDDKMNIVVARWRRVQAMS
ncbi:MAG: hypothetical protein PHR06_16730 [Candidatus Cloacimonetes bacterium]|nr:hypothetical protein [Candidatus Cloacimonadota bacterium]